MDSKPFCWWNAEQLECYNEFKKQKQIKLQDFFKQKKMDNTEEKIKMTRWEPNEKDFYSPSEDEFHIGFEYYIQIDRWDMYGNRCWSKVTMDKLHRPTSGAKVKFLDKEDIESLGWTFKGENKYEHNNGGFGIELEVLELGEIALDNWIYKIKNKSELKQLMKFKAINV